MPPTGLATFGEHGNKPRLAAFGWSPFARKGGRDFGYVAPELASELLPQNEPMTFGESLSVRNSRRPFHYMAPEARSLELEKSIKLAASTVDRWEKPLNLRTAAAVHGTRDWRIAASRESSACILVYPGFE